MQMLVHPIKKGFAPVAPMLFTLQLTLSPFKIIHESVMG